MITILYYGLYTNNIQIYWLIILLIGTAQSTVEEYRKCGRKNNCTLRNNPVSQLEQNLSADEFFRSPCYCDPDCEQFGDCCIDKSPWPRRYSEINNIPASFWACKRIEENLGIYVVESCKESGDVNILCSRKAATEHYHYTLDIPVLSVRTGIPYANVYCAICHNDAINLQPLKASIKCSGTSNITMEMLKEEGEYLPGLRSWKIGNETCTMIVNNSTEIEEFGRKCIPSVAHCPQTWHNVTVAEKCKSYQMLVKDNVTVFKNPHCAICNGVPLNNLHCSQLFQYKTKFGASLIIIFDFTWDPNSCRLPESVWDSLRGICKKMPCSDSSCYRIKKIDGEPDCMDKGDHTSSRTKPILTSEIEGLITLTCLSISVICLLLHNILYYLLPKKKNLPSNILNSLSWALILAQTLFLTGVSPIIFVTPEICKFIAVLVHYFFLTSFFWMNVMSIDIWHTFSKNALNTHKELTYKKYASYAWGFPMLITSTALLIDIFEILPEEFRPYYAGYPNVCWFANRVGLGIYLYLPMSCLLIVNTVLFIITVYWFQNQKTMKELAEASGRKDYIKLWLYVKLSIIMGLTWALCMIAAFAKLPMFWYPFTILNSLQGAIIFIMFDLKGNIMRLFLEKIGFKNYLKNGDRSSSKQVTKSSKFSTSLNFRSSLTSKL